MQHPLKFWTLPGKAATLPEFREYCPGIPGKSQSLQGLKDQKVLIDFLSDDWKMQEERTAIYKRARDGPGDVSIGDSKFEVAIAVVTVLTSTD